MTRDNILEGDSGASRLARILGLTQPVPRPLRIEVPAHVGSNFEGAPDLEFRLASKALELEQSGLSYQRIPPTNR